MAKKLEGVIGRVKTPGSYIKELPEGEQSKIFRSCSSLKEPARSKCIANRARSFREGHFRKKQKSEKEGQLA
jgi:hypothetical protein